MSYTTLQEYPFILKSIKSIKSILVESKPFLVYTSKTKSKCHKSVFLLFALLPLSILLGTPMTFSDGQNGIIWKMASRFSDLKIKNKIFDDHS